MSELITPRRANFRWQLLTTVSALAIAGMASGEAQASDTDHPTVWIELGGQLERVDGSREQFIPPFIANSSRASVWTQSPASVERPSRYAFGGEGKITFEPARANWIFTAAVRYGRSNSNRSVAQQSNIPTLVPFGTKNNVQMVPPILKLADEAKGENSESHAILDFMAGRDVGLGIGGTKSNISFGVRFAQFHSESNATLKSRPTLGDIILKKILTQYRPHYYPRNYMASVNSERSFHGIGPSLSWDASAPVVGNADAGQLTVDWGLNASVLFGRQKVRDHHQTSSKHIHVTAITKYNILSQYQHSNGRTHSRSVIVPNVGGFAGVSFKFPNAKVSMGYRADFFFNAMDGGLDAAKSTNRAFYGPFATISIGLGG